MTAPVWLTATPPTPNGDLHIGHMAGPYVAVDVLRRHLLAEGTPVLMTTGLDNHQSYVPAQGVRDGRTGDQVAERFGTRIVDAWRDADLRFDRIVDPTRTPRYVESIQAFFLKLCDQGAIVPRTRPLPFCVGCDRWLYEAFVVGGCPHCGERSNGNACEACCRPNDCGDLADPRCLACDEPAQLRDQTRLYLPLAPFADRLAEFWSRVSMPPRLRALCEVMAADGLPEIAVSHPTDWGVPVPVLGFEDQRIYVWFEMAPGYLLEYDPDTMRPASGPVQFFGIDNGYFHAVLFPASFLAWDPDLPLPTAFVVNEFYRLEGLKFSTSRRHAVWARDGLAETGADAMRLHVLRDRPNGRQTSFERVDLRQARQHLDDRWNGWLRALFSAVRAETGGAVPDEPPSGSGWDLLHTRLSRLGDDLHDAYSLDGFDPRRAVDLLDEFVRCAQDFGYVHQHEHDRAAYRAALAGQLAAASALASWAEPVVPAGAGRLRALLGVTAVQPIAAALAPLPPGTRLGEPDGPIFGG
jgi:methionyl-tRNA synthetase